MTVNYLRAYGGKAERKGDTWDLSWPDGERFAQCVFSTREAERLPEADLLTLENNRVRGLALNLPDGVEDGLHATLSAAGKQVQSGERSAWTRTFLVNNLMAIWSSPAAELTAFRDRTLRTLRDHPDQELVIHWAMISSVYPFWFNTARQTGRLLNLQAQTTQAQIVNRLKEQYGDRQTVSRNARFVVRSFID